MGCVCERRPSSRRRKSADDPVSSIHTHAPTHTSAGGIIEASIKLPGKSDTGGLWPAFWLMGNLGRATYEVRSVPFR